MLDFITVEKAMQIFLMCIVADFATGVIAANRNGNVKSSIMRKGIWLTSAEIVLLMLLFGFMKIVPEVNPYIRTIVGLLVFKELTSICENLEKTGLKLPGWIREGLAIANKSFDNNSNKLKGGK